MSFFDRVGNLGKGLWKVHKPGGGPPADAATRKAELQAELERLEAARWGRDLPAAGPAKTSVDSPRLDPVDAHRQRLRQAHADGVLTDAELASKLLDLAERSRPGAADPGGEGADPRSDAQPAASGEYPEIKRTL